MSRRSREDWADAALTALARGGLTAVAVEPIATGLGATKGSFYHHFDRRDDLVEAALERWAQATDAVIADLEASDRSPQARLAMLFDRVFVEGRMASAERALMGERQDARVAAVLRRVTERRLTFLRELLERDGLDADTSRTHALFLYATYLGHLQLRDLTPDLAALSDLRTAMTGLMSDNSAHQDACSGRPSS